MIIRIKEKIPVENPPEIGSLHEVVKIETIRKEKIYFILHNRLQIGIYARECEVINSMENTQQSERKTYEKS